MRPTEDCFSSEELDSIAFCTIDVTLMGCFGGSLAVFFLVLGQHLPFILGSPSAADVNVDILHLLPFIVFSWLSSWCIATVFSLIWLNINTLPNANIPPGISIVQAIFCVHCSECTRHNLRLFHDALNDFFHQSLYIGKAVRKFTLESIWWVVQKSTNFVMESPGSMVG